MTDKKPLAPSLPSSSPPAAPPSDAERADAAGELLADAAESRLRDQDLNEDQVQGIGGGLDQVRAPRREKIQGDMARQLKDLRDKREAGKSGVSPNPAAPEARPPAPKKKPKPK